MTPSDLKYAVEKAGYEPYFFTRQTMKFFGDTMRNYGVRKTVIMTRSGTSPVYELYRKQAVKHGLKSSAFFDMLTFERVFEEKGKWVKSSTFLDVLTFEGILEEKDHD